MSKSNGAEMVEVDGARYHASTFEYDGEKITARELAQDEIDDIGEACTDDKGKFNNRLNTRMLLARSIVTPVTSIDGVGKFGARKFSVILREFNKLNSLPTADPTPPAGSAGPTSPDGGEPTPTS